MARRRNGEWVDGLHTVEEVKPTAHAVKHQEMAIKRAYELNSVLMDILEQEGTVQSIKGLHRALFYEYKGMRDIYSSSSPEYKYPDVWAWVVDHWYTGGLKRSVEAAMHNITATNREAINKGRNDVIYG